MKMNMRLRDVLVLLIAALVFLPSGASAKGPTSAPTSSPTPKPTTASPTPKPTTANPTTAEPTTTTEICEAFGEKLEQNDPCIGYSMSCCTNSAVTGGCCYVKSYPMCQSEDTWKGLCCASYDTNSSKAEECTDDSDTDTDDLARVLFASVSTAGASAVTSTSMTAALLMMALVVVGYVAFVLVKKHQQKKGASYTWPEEDETTPIVA